MVASSIELRVYRYDPKKADAPRYDNYEVPYSEGMTVLDALDYVYENLDPTLAYRKSCRQGSCGSCAVLVNAKPCAACRTLVKEGKDLTISPLLHFDVVKDLVTDISRGTRRLMRIRPFVERQAPVARPEVIMRSDIEPIKDLRKCIECWSCISACPAIADAWQEFAGPLPMRQLARLKLDPRDLEDRVKMAVADGLYDCTTCRACVEACPKEIDIPAKAIEKLRAYAAIQGLGPLPGHMEFVRLVDETGRSVTKKNASLLEQVPEVVRVENPVDKVAFFTGCLIDLRMQNTGKALINTLATNGVEVHIPKEQVCCGSPAFRTGAIEVAKKQVIKNTEIFEKLGIGKVVVGCSGCGLTLKTNFREILETERGRKADFKVYDINEYLMNELGNRLVKPTGELNLRLTYHDPCHLNRGQGIKDEPRRLLQMIPGVELIEMRDADRCCGSGGGVRAGRRALSMAIARRKAELVRETEADICVTSCPFCTVQLQDILQSVGATTKVKNVVDLLSESYSRKFV
ncbi:MAG: fumarate reductase (CoM/CoB) subunit TfrB [Promethearchaeati archaeon SRVP18_Atabeyarchaeia-1]